LGNDNPSRLKQEIIERIKSMVFLCMYCDSQIASVIDFEYNATGVYARAFFICPDCRKKFVVKIEDLGRTGMT
jgi:ribosomal protein L37AE/L43A